MIQVMAGLLCNVFAFLLFEYYMEYANDTCRFHNRYIIYGIYVVQFLLCYFFVWDNYLISVLFFGILLIRQYSKELGISMLFAVSLSVQMWIFSGFSAEVLLYNLFVGGGICLMPGLNQSIKRQLLWHGANVIYLFFIVGICDVLFRGGMTFVRLGVAAGVYVISCVVAYLMGQLLANAIGRIRKQMIFRYVEQDSPLLCLWREQSFKTDKMAVQVSRLAGLAAREVAANDMVATIAGRYYNVGILKGRADYGNCVEIRREYHLPKYLDEIWREQYMQDCIFTTKESAIVALAGMLVTMLAYAEKKQKNTYSIPEIVTKVIHNQYQKGKWNRCGFSVEELLRLEQCFIKTLLEAQGHQK